MGMPPLASPELFEVDPAGTIDVRVTAELAAAVVDIIVMVVGARPVAEVVLDAAGPAPAAAEPLMLNCWD